MIESISTGEGRMKKRDKILYKRKKEERKKKKKN